MVNALFYAGLRFFIASNFCGCAGAIVPCGGVLRPLHLFGSILCPLLMLINFDMKQDLIIIVLLFAAIYFKDSACE